MIRLALLCALLPGCAAATPVQPVSVCTCAASARRCPSCQSFGSGAPCSHANHCAHVRKHVLEVPMIADKLKAYGWQLLALALAGLLLWQTLRLASAEVAAAQAQTTLSNHIAAQAQASQAETTKKADALLTHAGAQQENTHVYIQDLQRLEAARVADARRITSLQHHIRAAATRNAQLAADSAAARDLADQHQRLAASAAEGAGVVGELIGLVEVRDAQVKALQGQVAADGGLLERSFLRP